MKELDVNHVYRKINYSFSNEDLLYQAFTRASFAQENGGESNENLELIGDSILYMYVTKILTERYGYLKSDEDDDFDIDNDYDEFCVSNNFTEKELTDIRQKLISGEYLASRVDKMGIKDFMYMGNGDIKKHEENVTKVKADLFEAILGAIAIDCEWDAEELQNSVEFMLDIDKYLSTNLLTDDNYIALLQQWNQKEHGEPPHYEIVQNYDGTPTAYVTIETSRGAYRFSGDGKNGTVAKMEAAQKAYEFLEEIDELFTIMDEITEKVTIDNAINKLQELAQKGYFSMPEYYQGDTEVYDNKGNPVWECTCFIRSESIEHTAIANAKKTAKKYAAYLVMCDIFNWENEYE